MDYEKLTKWVKVSYRKVRRNEQTYRATEEFFTAEISRLVKAYPACPDIQSQRLIRDSIDFCLRRAHNYSIREKIGAHYTQVGLQGERTFEHLVPAAAIRDLLLNDVMPVRYALNAPTVLLSSSNDGKLRRAGLVSSSGNLFYPFKRYLSAGIEDQFETSKGDRITNLDAWSLRDHYELIFGSTA